MPLVGSQALPTLLKTIVVKKSVYPNLIVHSPKCIHDKYGVGGRGEPFDLPTKIYVIDILLNILLTFDC